MGSRRIIFSIYGIFISGFLAYAGAGCSSNIRPPDERTGTFQEAQKLYDEGKSSPAESMLLVLRMKNPSDAKVHFLLGRIYLEENKVDQSIQELEGVVNLDPKNAAAYVTLARLYQAKGQFDQALAAALQAQKLDPYGSVYHILGRAYLNKGDYEGAVRSYEKALIHGEDSTWVYNNLGLVYIQMNKWSEAETQLKKAIESDSDNAVAHNNLGVVYHQQGNYELALQEFKTALSLDKDYSKASQNIADTEKIIDRIKRAHTPKKPI